MDSEKTVLVNHLDFEDTIDQLYKELGKAYYEGAFEDPLPQLIIYFDKITQLKSLQENKNQVCPQCGNIVDSKEVYCGKCGYRLQ